MGTIDFTDGITLQPFGATGPVIPVQRGPTWGTKGFRGFSCPYFRGENKSLTQEENKCNNAVWSRNSVGAAGDLLPGWIKLQPSGSKEDYAKGTVRLQM